MESLEDHSKIRTAVVVLPPLDLLNKNTSEGSWLSPDVNVAGLPLLQRTLLSLQKGGISRLMVVSQNPFPHIKTEIERDSRLNGKVTWRVQDSLKFPDDIFRKKELILFTRLNVHFHWELIKELSRLNSGNQTQVVPLPNEGPTDGFNPVGLLVLPGGKIKDIHSIHPQSPEQEIKFLNPKPEHLFFSIESPSDCKNIETALLNRLGSPLDGMVDTYLNRPVSKILTRLFLKTSITPNQITVLSFLVGALSAIAFAMGGYLHSIVGALLFQFSSMVDCSDGEVARLKFMESPLGRWLDIALDNLAHLLIFSAVTWTAIRENPGGGYFLWGLLSLVGISLSFLSVVLSIRLQERLSSLPKADQTGRALNMMNKVIAMMANRDFSIIVLIFSVGNILPWLLVLVGTGSNLFGLFLLGLYLTARCQQTSFRKKTGMEKESAQT